MPQISVVIITYNEEKNIRRCLDSIQDIADDIVVIDSFSTDRTEEICLQKGARFVKHPFKGHIEQKNYAITQAKYPHILSLDADEALSEELRRSILEAKANWKYDGYFMNRLTNYCGQWIHHCSWYPDRKLRLFDSRKGSWQGINPHDEYKLHREEPTGRLTGDLLHYSYFSIKGHIDQINKFSDIAAQSLYNRGKRANLLKVVFGPFWTFLRNYFIKLGFLDGFYGFIICMISAHATFLKYAKLKQLYLFATHRGLGISKIIVSRTDAIGDVVLTLPMCGILKSQFPDLRIAFFGRSYTKDVIDACEHIDEFLNYDEFEQLEEHEREHFLRKTHAEAIIHVFPKKKIARAAKRAGIGLRIGTSSRLHHWLYCNKLVALSRRNSDNHEAQLNLSLLYSFGIESTFPLNRIHQYYGITNVPVLPEQFTKLIDPEKLNVIIHPKSRGNGREWGLDNFQRLIEMMPGRGIDAKTY
jgi:glycosyltransferase involved in cell wall biosynthesis